MKGHQGIADLILEQPGVDLNFRDDSGSTLVMLTAANHMTKNIVDQMEYLVNKKGAKVDLVDVNGQNAVSGHIFSQFRLLAGSIFPEIK